MRDELKAVLWMFLVAIAAMALAIGVASSARGQGIVDSYQGGISGLATAPIHADTVFQLEMRYGPLVMLSQRLPYSALNNSSFAMPHSGLLHNNEVEQMVISLLPDQAGLDGVSWFLDSEIAPLAGTAIIQEIRLSLFGMRQAAGIDVYGAGFRVDAVGYKLESIPEPGTWVLGLFGLLAIALGCRKVKLHSQLGQVIQPDNS
jgi:hypothetical protein